MIKEKILDITPILKTNKKRILITLFGIVAVIQLSVPVSMIIRNNEAFNNGRTYYFLTRPVDPNDPFRGKYIQLGFRDNSFYDKKGKWEKGDIIYITFKEDKDGFASIKRGTKTKPRHSRYLKTKVVETNGSKVTVDYFFNKFFMEESKAKPAERITWSWGKKVYAQVRIKDGTAVLTDVLVDGESISDLVEKSR